jgi:hypothetical protein
MNVRAQTHHVLLCTSFLLAACSDPLDGDEAGASLGGGTAETGGEAPGNGDEGDSGQSSGQPPGDGDGDAGNDIPQAGFCDSVSFALDTLQPNVMLVLDKSGSMNQFTWDDDGILDTPEVTRWHTLHDVVTQITTDYQDIMRLGVTLFPAIDAEVQSGTFEGSCKVNEEPEVPVGDDNSLILDHIPAADDLEFSGASPATAGVLTATNHLVGLDETLPRAMIFVTDGAANCASPENFVTLYDETLPQAISDAWEDAGIPTFVVGIDISEDGGAVDVNPRDALHVVALAGAVPNEGEVGFYDATTPEALTGALEEITERVACQVELDVDPEALDGMVIEASGQEFVEVGSCKNQDGWVQLDPLNNPGMIELCNAACEVAGEAGGAVAKLSC